MLRHASHESPTERAASQRHSAPDSLRLFPRRLLLPPTGRMLLTLPSVPGTLRMANLGLRLSPLSHLYPLSQLERAAGFLATSLAAEARGPLPCQHCLSKRRVRCLGRGTGGRWYETCWRQGKEPACAARRRHTSIASHLVSLRWHAERSSPGRAAPCRATPATGRQPCSRFTARCALLGRR
jgi:hypothetical protein